MSWVCCKSSSHYYMLIIINIQTQILLPTKAAEGALTHRFHRNLTSEFFYQFYPPPLLFESIFSPFRSFFSPIQRHNDANLKPYMQY